MQLEAKKVKEGIVFSLPSKRINAYEMSSMLIHQNCTVYQTQAWDASKLQSASVWWFDNDFVWLHCAAILLTVRDASTMECITRCDASSLQSASVASDREEDISSGARLLLLWASDGLYVILPEYGFGPQKIQHRHYITDRKIGQFRANRQRN